MRRLSLIIIGLYILLAASCSSAQPRSKVGLAPTGLEIPRYDTTEDVVVHTGYTASYNHQTLVPNWVAYELTAAELSGTCNVPRNFSRDPDVAFPKASREDYSHSGWDKGHMAARADMKWSGQALEESDYFTNICPQNHELNAGLWNRIEGLARHAAERYGSVYIVTGPLFSDTATMGTIGAAGVCVPSAFFKTLVVQVGDTYKGVGFVVPNQAVAGRPSDYAVSIDSIEVLIDRDLYPTLPQPEVEAQFEWADWSRRNPKNH